MREIHYDTPTQLHFITLEWTTYVRLLDILDSVEAMDHARDCRFMDGLPQASHLRCNCAKEAAKCNCAKEAAKAYREALS